MEQEMDPESNTDKKWQWNLYDSVNKQRGIMLNTDMELAYNIDVNMINGTECNMPSMFSETGSYVPGCSEQTGPGLSEPGTTECRLTGPGVSEHGTINKCERSASYDWVVSYAKVSLCCPS